MHLIQLSSLYSIRPMKVLLSLLLFFISIFTSQAQNSLQFSVKDKQNQAIPFASILFKKASDSSQVKGYITDENGYFKVEKMPVGLFHVKIQATGFEAKWMNSIEIKAKDQLNWGTISLMNSSTMLQEVKVKATKAFIEQKLDKTVVNVENSVMAAGNTTYELLERSPGIIIDKDGNISIKGRSGAKVMIDGKISYLIGAELSNFLRNLPADQISQLEIMSNPSSRYDAAGTGGLVNIKLKKNANIGMNGSANLTYAQGFYAREALGINMNYRKNAWNVFGNATAGSRHVLEQNYLLRKFSKQKEQFEQNFRYPNQNKNSQIKTGVDWYYSKKTTLGLLVSGAYNNDYLTNGLNETVQSNDVGKVLSRTNTYNSFTMPNYNYATNLNFKHSFDTTGKELTVDLDYAKFSNDNQNDYIASYLYGDFSKIIPDTIIRVNSASNIDQYSLKADYVIPNFWKSKWEMGIKSSYVKTNNILEFRGKTEFETNYNYLAEQANRFIYTEQIHAAYLNSERKIGKLSYQIGLRSELTLADGTSKSFIGAPDSTFYRNYLQVFPSTFLQYDVGKNHTVGLTYSRRIDRPAYTDLNPFVFYIDNYTYNVGNPMLMPQLTNSLELSHTYQGGISTTLGYSLTDQVITQLLKQDSETRRTYQTTANLAQRATYSLGFSLPIPIKNWWTSNTDIYINRAELKGKIETNPINTSKNMFYVSSNHTFTLPKDYKFEIGGNFFSGGLESAFLFGAGGSLNLGIQKTILNTRGTIRLNAQDILYTSNPEVTINYADLDVIVRPRNDTRIFRINFAYRFGNSLIKGARQRSTGLDAEKSRVKK
jgi:Outer membrane protein beta-barrel family/CarboxypepD_reg-like domain/TonB-dependent Receptor Plug Domain